MGPELASKITNSLVIFESYVNFSNTILKERDLRNQEFETAFF